DAGGSRRRRPRRRSASATRPARRGCGRPPRASRPSRCQPTPAAPVHIPPAVPILELNVPSPAGGAHVPAAAAAAAIAVDYLTALADHRYDHAQDYAHACTAAQQHSLDQLWLWLDSMPTQAIKVADARIAPAKEGVTVEATLYAKFGPKPYSAWVALGPKTLRL